ncbi:MAG: hypothetical protein ACI9EF_000940, partial [Pseudohongiellaceae bacterium]
MRISRRNSGRNSGRSASAGWWLLATLLICVPVGCVSLTRGGLFPADRDAVFVGYFVNDTFFRDVEFKLTEGVVAEILSR